MPEKCSGWLYFMEDKYVKTFFCPIKARFKNMQVYKEKIKAAVPKQLYEKSFANFDQTKAQVQYDVVKKFIFKKAYLGGSNLLLIGGYGCGKTHLAVAAIRETMISGTAAFFQSSFFFDTIQAIHEKFDTIKDFDLVVIDDLSNETNNRIVIQELYGFLNYRYEAKKGIILTTNISLDSLKEILGDRLIDRLAERSLPVLFDAGSYRKFERGKFISWSL